MAYSWEQERGKNCACPKEPGKLTLEMPPRLMTPCSLWTWDRTFLTPAVQLLTRSILEAKVSFSATGSPEKGLVFSFRVRGMR